MMEILRLLFVVAFSALIGFLPMILAYEMGPAKFAVAMCVAGYCYLWYRWAPKPNRPQLKLLVVTDDLPYVIDVKE